MKVCKTSSTGKRPFQTTYWSKAIINSLVCRYSSKKLPRIRLTHLLRPWTILDRVPASLRWTLLMPNAWKAAIQCSRPARLSIRDILYSPCPALNNLASIHLRACATTTHQMALQMDWGPAKSPTRLSISVKQTGKDNAVANFSETQPRRSSSKFLPYLFMGSILLILH